MRYESWNPDVMPGAKRFTEARDGVGLAMPTQIRADIKNYL